MMLRWVLVGILTVGCSARRTEPPGTQPSGSPAERSPLERAQQLERGDGVPRDYRKAAKIYEEACARGKGDLVACRHLVFAIGHARGTATGKHHALAFAKTMCERGDVFGCFLCLMSEDATCEAAIEKLPNPADACDNGDAISCEVVLAIAPGRAGMDERLDRACRLGVVEACIWQVGQVGLCTQSDDGASCVEYVEREWKEQEREDKLHALSRVRAACERGVADACAELPGREISLAELCKAHDYEACGELGCEGDQAAAALATQHGVVPSC